MIRYYLGLRRDVSLLLDHGHQHAAEYPVAVAWSEARIVRQRIADIRNTDAVVTQAVISSVLSKPGGKALTKLLKRLDSD